jgi:malate synthase
MRRLVESIEILGKTQDGYAEVLTPEALEFLGRLQRTFGTRREELLRRRVERQAKLDSGAVPDFLEETRSVREGDWKIAPVPRDLEERKVEITGPCDRKMVINALNSGASTFMADFEDSCSPTWENIVLGQANLTDAIERKITFEGPNGKQYRLNEKVAVLLVRPRGWHLEEKHLRHDGKPLSASFVDFGLYFFHNHKRLKERGTGPYFYLPKMESHLEARLWNDVFDFAEDAAGIARGTIKATVLIETILAAFEMDEILHELRGHAAGLNAGRWDYMFSTIKKFSQRPNFLLPDRAQITMTVPFMRAYTELLVKTCHRRGAHAMGGMAAFIPSRKDAAVNENALRKVREDKTREANDGFDGTWVAHPDLVPVARAEFDKVLGSRPNQLGRSREEVSVRAAQLVDFTISGGTTTEAGLRNNVSVAIQYLDSWLRGTGAVGINNLMEDAATAEISRSQVWQWVRNGARLQEGASVTPELVRRIVAEEVSKIRQAGPQNGTGRVEDAATLFERVALSRGFVEFLTIPAYEVLE